MKENSSKIKLGILITVFTSLWVLVLSCSSVDYISSSNGAVDSILSNKNEINLVTYNIKAIYDKEEDQLNNLIEFIKSGEFDFVLFRGALLPGAGFFPGFPFRLNVVYPQRPQLHLS